MVQYDLREIKCHKWIFTSKILGSAYVMGKFSQVNDISA